MLDIRVRVPAQSRPGDVIEVRTLALAPPLADPADGFGPDGVPLQVCREFQARFEGRAILRCDVQPGFARDFALTFPFKVTTAGTLTLIWSLASGATVERHVAIDIAGRR